MENWDKDGSLTDLSADDPETEEKFSAAATAEVHAFMQHTCPSIKVEDLPPLDETPKMGAE